MFARTLAHLGAAAEAVNLLKAANERRPGDFWIVFDLACAFGKTKPPATDEEIRYFRGNSLVVNPQQRHPRRHNLGGALRDKGQWDEAMAEYRKALQIKPDNAEAHNNLGNALYDKGQLDEAITEYRKALQIKPDYAEAHNNLGNALSEKGQLDEAMTEYRKALQIQPDFAEGPQRPRQRPPRQGPVGRGDRRIPQGPPNQARLR